MIELRHLSYFFAIAEERNFTRAAERVGIQQPPLSRQIRDLEKYVGARLFRRDRKGAVLTEAGTAFLKTVQHVPRQIERAVQEARRAARGEVGSLRLGYTGSAGFNPVVAEAIRSFRRDYPDVELSLEEANTLRLIQGVNDGIYDVVVLRPGASGSEGLQERLLVEEAMLAVLPAGHPAATTERVDLAVLKDEPFILLSQAAGPVLLEEIHASCKAAGFEPRLGQVAPQIASVINLVSSGLGVSLVPASMQFMQVPGVVYRSIAGRPPIARLALAFRRDESAVLVRNFCSGCIKRA